MKTHNSKFNKIQNRKLVIEKLVELRETSRVDLSKTTTLNKATVSSVINELIEKNIVIETDERYKTSGRSAKVIALNKNAGRIISIELLTDAVYGVIANLYGEILYETTTKVSSTDFSDYLKDILSTIDELKTNTYDSKYGVIGIGVAVYGILSKNKKIKFATFTSWKDIELKKIIEDYTGLKTYVENEANISALGEKTIAFHYPNLVTLNIGIGVGAGIIIEDKLYTGHDGYAGEIGHTTLVPNGKACVCGNSGCLERYISDTAIIEKYKKLTNETISINDIIKRYLNEDKSAIIVFKEFIKYISAAINNISLFLNPQAIIVKSKFINRIPESISLIKNNLKSHIMNLEVLTTSSFHKKTNVLGLTHIIIQGFLDIDNYKVPQNI
ncbi:MAG: ROK family protein [Tenericutes bacterium]|jgi:predicted NBD/HSP70 family sugar kinase|nr:ROK family protein [Mycoplasmatota bacterium]